MFFQLLGRLPRGLTLPNRTLFSTQKRSMFYRKLAEVKSYSIKRSSYLNVALGCFVFAMCFAGIPLYRTFCEHMGLVGDSNKKEYNFDGTKINNFKKYKVTFTGEMDPDVNWEFQPVEKEVIVSAGETAIVFYRLYNKEPKPIVGFSVYNISPEDCNVYFSKIQCFCFNQQLINPKEELLLPIFFYLEPEINDDPDVSRIDLIKVAYTFLKSAKQNLAKFAEEELKRVEQNKRKLNEIRAQKMNMTLEDYIQRLEQEEMKSRLEAQKKQDEEIRSQHKEELQRLKHKADFQQDLIKAELISKQFQINARNHIDGQKMKHKAASS